MKRNRLSSIQWQFVRVSIMICLVITIIIFLLLSIDRPKEMAMLLKQAKWGIPFVVQFALISIVVGAIFGYWIGHHVKKRLEIITKAALAYERGNFSYRLPDIGEDEIGQISVHLNEMAKRI